MAVASGARSSGGTYTEVLQSSSTQLTITFIPCWYERVAALNKLLIVGDNDEIRV
jgi:hypothetical protein